MYGMFFFYHQPEQVKNRTNHSPNISPQEVPELFGEVSCRETAWNTFTSAMPPNNA